MTLIQRFGGALNLNVHFHMLFLDGVYVEALDGSLAFRWVKAPTGAELGLDDEPMEALLVHSITYRIAVGPRAGRRVFTLQSLTAGDEGSGTAASQVGGFSLHAGVAARADERKKL